jgi:HSP20 family protein
VIAEGDDVIVRLDLPGVDVERDVTVSVDEGQVVIGGERRDERDPLWVVFPVV